MQPRDYNKPLNILFQNTLVHHKEPRKNKTKQQINKSSKDAKIWKKQGIGGKRQMLMLERWPFQ